MSSFTFNAYASLAVAFLRKKPEGPYRDPLVVICHIPFLVAWPMWYALSGIYTWASTLYFSAFIGLYLCSAYYHYERITRRSLLFDQIAIGLFIIATPLPFVTAWWVWVCSGLLALLTIILKRYETMTCTHDVSLKLCIISTLGSYYHLALGIWSATIMVLCGIPEMGAHWLDGEALQIYIIIALFLLEWVIYHFEIEYKPLAPWFGKTELKHFNGAVAKSLLNVLIIV